MRYEKQGLERWANTDPSLHYNTIPRRGRGPTWQGSYMYCLTVGSYDAAELIRLRNDPDYRLDREEAARAARVLPPLQSCAQLQAREDDREAA